MVRIEWADIEWARGSGRGERIGGRGPGGGKKIYNSDTWVPQPVVGIDERFRGWMGAEKLDIEERISMTRTNIPFRGWI
jgi:hypothetical protein